MIGMLTNTSMCCVRFRSCFTKNYFLQGPRTVSVLQLCKQQLLLRFEIDTNIPYS